MRTLSLLIAVLIASSLSARNWQDGVADSIGSGSSLMVYRYYLPPNYDDSVNYPLVLSLHGAGQWGTNNSSQVAFNIGPLLNMTEFEHPAILLAPQLPTSGGWGPINSRDRTDEILERIIGDFSVDTTRLYITGLSAGGFGTMEYLHRFNGDQPEGRRFAAAVPLSGAYAHPTYAVELREIPIWLAHGSADTVVPPTASENTYRIISGIGGTSPIPFDHDLLGGPTAIDGNVRYTELTNRGHDIWSRVYARNELYDWMFAQTLVPEPSTCDLLVLAFIVVVRSADRRKKPNRRVSLETVAL